MINNNKNNSRVIVSGVFQVSGIAAAMALASSPTWAGDTIEFDNGLTMDWAVTTSYGIGVRTADQSRRLLSVNADDGNRNFDQGGLTTNRVGALGELILRKTTSTQVAVPGDVIQYRIEVANRDARRTSAMPTSATTSPASTPQSVICVSCVST